MSLNHNYKGLIILLITLFPMSILAQLHYTVKVNVKNAKPSAKAYLFYMKDQKVIKDSTMISGNQFVFKGVQDAPMKAYVLLSHSGSPIDAIKVPDRIGVYLENGTVIVDTPDSLVRAKVGGTALNKDQQQMVDVLLSYEVRRKEMNDAYDRPSNTNEDKQRIKDEYGQLEKRKHNDIVAFVKAHPNSLVSINLLLTSVDPGRDLNTARELFNLLSPNVQASTNGMTYRNAIGQSQLIEVGGQAPLFTLKNTKDVDVSLASFKGKYVLVDFWASWCAPCRLENPNVVKAYEKYKSKNFTVLGVSLDGGNGGQEKWLAAIKKDGLPWEQVSDLMGWQSKTAKLYKVTAIPANFLIDPTGKIIARDLGGAELEEKLKSIL